MKKTLTTLLLVIMTLLLPVQGMSTLYSWTDENGVVIIKDTPPPAGVKAQVFNSQGSSATYKGKNGAGAEKSKEYPKVEIYMTEWCPTCKKAIKYLDAKGIDYIKYDIDKDSAAHTRFSEDYRQRAIPYTIIGDVKILGFSKERFDSALGIKQKK